jgi:hypothetical protein
MTVKINTIDKPLVNRTFVAPDLLQVAMPMGGLGAGAICLNGSGGLQDFAIRNRPATTAKQDGHTETEAAFAIVHIKGEHPVTKLVEGPMPVEKIYDQGLQAQGYRHGGHEGLPRFENCRFEAGFPFGMVVLEDATVPLRATVTGWNPFIPGDDTNSCIPCVILEYQFENGSDKPVEFQRCLPTGGQRREIQSSMLPKRASSAVELASSTVSQITRKVLAVRLFMRSAGSLALRLCGFAADGLMACRRYGATSRPGHSPKTTVHSP